MTPRVRRALPAAIAVLVTLLGVSWWHGLTDDIDNDGYGVAERIRDLRAPVRELPHQTVDFSARMYTMAGVGDYRLTEINRKLPLDRTALVLVDCWSGAPEGAKRIMRERLRPVLDEARRAGIMVIHAPSTMNVRAYPQWKWYSSDVDRYHAGELRFSSYLAGRWIRRKLERNWPSLGARRVDGDLALAEKRIDAGRRAELAAWTSDKDNYKIYEAVAPLDTEWVVASGAQLNRLLESRRIIHLVYAGFSSSECLLFQTYGIVPFHGRGYDITLLRDCTISSEVEDSRDEKLLTRSSVTLVEQLFGTSTTSIEWMSALGRVNAAGGVKEGRS